ncbi:MAG: alpha/beta fold hydrolase [Bacteroidales bacterium]|nr:alpha/beta fold hydrolase [Bacteroidales bacterium]
MFNNTVNKEPITFNDGFIDRKDGHKVYYHEYGTPDGTAILVFHGGPGNKSKPKHAAMFDLTKYHVILFDQRGSGKSSYKNRFENNNTQNILGDAKAILDQIGIKKVKIVSESWGSALALLFAELYPEVVSEMVLNSVFLARKKDIQWITNGTKIFYPDLYDIIKIEPGEDFLSWNYKNIFSDDIEKQNISTKKFGSYERNLGSLSPELSMDYIPSQEHRDGFKLYMHFLNNYMFLDDDQILKNITKIQNIPVTIIQNRIDMITPMEGAWELHRALPKSKIIIVDDLGHATDKQRDIVRQIAKNL